MAYSRYTLLGNTVWTLFEKISTQLVSFIVSVVLARILLPEEYGVIAVLLIFITFATVIIDGGLNTALIQKKDADNIDFSTILYTSLLIAIILYLILFFSAPLIANIYGNSKLSSLLRVLGLILFFNSLNGIQRAYVAKHMLFRKLFYSSFGSAFISGTCGILMAYNGFGEWALVAQQLLCQIVKSIMIWFTIKWRPVLVFSFDRLKGLFDYGWKIFLANIIISIYENIRGLIIGKMYSPASLAFFERGKSFPYLFMENINSSIRSVIFPAFSAEQDDKERIKQMMRRSMSINCYVIFPLLVGLFVITESLVIVLLTEKWIPAIPFIRIFCIAYFLMPIQISNIEAIKALGHSGTILKLEILKKIIEAVILVVSFMIDVYAVAWGIVAYNAICLAINLSPNRKLLKYGILEQLYDIAPMMFIAILMGCTMWSIYCFHLSHLTTLIIQTLVGLITYLLLSRFFKIESFLYILETLKSRKNHD